MTFLSRAVAGEIGARFVSVGLNDLFDANEGGTYDDLLEPLRQPGLA